MKSDLPIDIDKNAKENLVDVDIKATFMPTLRYHFCKFVHYVDIRKKHAFAFFLLAPLYCDILVLSICAIHEYIVSVEKSRWLIFLSSNVTIKLTVKLG